MLFRKMLLSLLSFTLMCTAAMARDPHERPTMSLGYQQARIKDFGDIHGGNFRFQFENAERWGVMGSLTAMKNNWDDEYTVCRQADTKCRDDYKIKHAMDKKAEYYSLQAGPTYRVSDNISVFALAGLSHSSVITNEKDDPQQSPMTGNQHSSNQYAYSSGVTLNATDNLALTAGYEGARASYDGKKHGVRSVFMDVGYRF